MLVALPRIGLRRIWLKLQGNFTLKLNERATALCDALCLAAEELHLQVHETEDAARIIDCGVNARGGLETGRRVAEICLAGLGQVSLVPASPELSSGAAVMVRTDHPVAACMASQYAGWQVTGGKFFAMGSGPMRAAAGREALFEKIGHTESATMAVGVLETGKLPTVEVCREIAAKCHVEPSRVTLLAAPTRSQVGNVQVVARSIETSLHKLFELGFDLSRVESGIGVAPLPPPAADDLTGIGRTNDAILYGGEVTLYVRGDDANLQDIGPKVPSCASSDHGQPFGLIFERYERDFYRIDPHLFSPAVVTFCNLDSGNSFRFGHLVPRVIHQSFGLMGK
jgi:methenyltetrahydromethanopterin cyclohydrolase